MPTVDRRTRFQGDVVALDPGTFLEDTACPLEANGAAAGGPRPARLVPLTLDVDGEQLTFAADDRGRLAVRAVATSWSWRSTARPSPTWCRTSASTFGLQLTGRAEVGRGGVDAFVEWEPVLRCLLDGRPVYEPGTIEFLDRQGAPLDLHRSFTLEDAHEEIGHFLAEAGFLHLEGVFTEAEMAAVSAELDDAIAAAELDDGASWWARTTDGEWYPSRILGFNQKSPTLRELLRSDRFATIGTFTDDRFVQRDPDVGDSAEGLLKKVGVVEGISDVSWHKDCSMGGHSRGCCGLTVGISVTGARPRERRARRGRGLAPRQHRAARRRGPRPPALPAADPHRRRHGALLVHAAHEPAAGLGRAPGRLHRLRARAPAGRPAARARPGRARRQRAALNDHVRRGQQADGFSQRTGNFEL